MTSSEFIRELDEMGKTLRVADPLFLPAVKEASYDLISHSLQLAPMSELIRKDQRKNRFPSSDPIEWLTNFGKSSDDRYNEALRGCDKILKALHSLEEISLYIDACYRSGLEEANHGWEAVIHERDMPENRADVETPVNASDNRIKAKSSGAILIKIVNGEDLQ